MCVLDTDWTERHTRGDGTHGPDAALGHNSGTRIGRAESVARMCGRKRHFCRLETSKAVLERPNIAPQRSGGRIGKVYVVSQVRDPDTQSVTDTNTPPVPITTHTSVQRIHNASRRGGEMRSSHTHAHAHPSQFETRPKMPVQNGCSYALVLR